jgi:Na+/H+ antiporter NhaD/arsenite permease-like protein
MRTATLQLSPPALLAVMIAMSGVLSAILTNDVVVVAMVPLLVQLCQTRGLNPVPFLLGFAFAANGGSAGTVIGSPQNMIVAEALHLSFLGFMKGAMVPALLSLPVIWAVMVVLYRGRWAAPAATQQAAAPVPFDKVETIKGAIVTTLVVAAFCLSSWPRPLVALAAAAILLLNRRIASSNVLKHVDGDLFILLGGLFVVNAAFAITGLPQQAMGELQQWGVDLQHPLTLLLTIGVLSDIVGNNPAVLLVVPYLKSVDPELAGAAMALGTGLASNIVVFGSLAGIIVVEEAGRSGVTISAAEFSRAGVPVVLVCLLIAAAWLVFLQ